MHSRQQASAATQHNAPLLSRLAFVVLCGYLTTIVVEAPLRFMLANVGAALLLYLRDVAAVAMVALVFAYGVAVRQRFETVPVVLLSVLGVHFAVGVASGLDVKQVMFGFKTFVPLLFAATVLPLLRDRFAALAGFIGVLFLCSLAGVLLNWRLGPMPWEGLVYDTALGTVTSAVQWWTYGGQARLPGFARTSFDAAAILAVTGMWVMLSRRRLVTMLVVAGLTLFAIYLTTTKGMILAFGAAAAWVTARHVGVPLRASWVYVPMSLIAFLVPALVVGYQVHGIWSPAELPTGLISLFERFDDMWPRAMKLLESPVSPLLGQGLGAIGAAQVFMGVQDPDANAADNIFVYCYVTFGVLGVVYLFSLVALARARPEDDGGWSRFRGAMLILVFTYGLTTNVLESAFLLPFVGLVVGDLLGSETRQQQGGRRRRSPDPSAVLGRA